MSAAAAAVATPAHAQFGDFLNRLSKAPGAVPPATGTPTTAPPAAAAQVKPGVQSIVPRGYSEQFIPVRAMISDGRFAEAIERFTPPAAPGASVSTSSADPAPSSPSSAKSSPAKPATTAASAGASPSSAPTAAGPIVSDIFLANAEMGLIELESGAPDKAVEHLRMAEDGENARRDDKSVKATAGKAARGFLGMVTGQKGFNAYTPLDHERVLQLNYLSLAYLLQGERRCYNVTRRCIDQQGLLKIKFDKELEDYKARYAQKENDKTVSDADRTALTGLTDQFTAYDVQANRVPNAYVNPLGDYLAGVIQEICSRQQPALRDNSRIAYQNAAKLCGQSVQLSAAAKAMARPRVPPNERVVHVIVGEGFAPQREVMTFGLAIKGQVVPVRVPIFKPVESRVQRLAVTSATGSTMATLDPIGDFEAIRLRDQHDRIPGIMLDVVGNTVASYFAGQAANHFGLFGLAANGIRELNAAPDTRSWLSLPRRFHVARVVVPASAKAVNLAAYDVGGRRIAVQTSRLLPGETQSIVYARATNDGLHVQGARRLWIEGQLEETQA